jgi:hypothetical protein
VSGRRGFRREVVALADDAIGLVGLGDQELALGAAQLVLRAAGVNAELTRTQFLDAHRRLSQVVGCHEAVVHRVVLENKKKFQYVRLCIQNRSTCTLRCLSLMHWGFNLMVK